MVSSDTNLCGLTAFQDCKLAIFAISASFYMLKNSDSDYKAEDEDSANEHKKANRGSKKGAIRLNKKEMMETAQHKAAPEQVYHQYVKQPMNLQEYNTLLQIKDAQEFSLNYKIFLAKVVKVTDGDTVKIVIWLNGHPTKFIIRLNGVDTPQCRKGDAKEFGKKVKEIIATMIEGKVVKIETGEFDKYGRILGRIYSYSNGKELCINDFLVEENLAKQYGGKTKSEFTSEDQEDFLLKEKGKSWPKTINFPYEEL